MTLDASLIVRSLGGRWRARHGMCKCPAHDDKTPSLSVTQSTTGDVLVHDFGGCSQAAVIAALKALSLWSADRQGCGAIYAPRPAPGSVRAEEERRAQQVHDLWDCTTPARGTLAGTYLKHRGITLAPPTSLRYLAALDHFPTRTKWPAMIAGLTDGNGALLAVQRTYLARDGRGKAPIAPNKMTLGVMRDGAVKFGEPSGILGLAEGIETALSAKQAYSLPVWGVLGCGRFEAIAIPDGVSTVVIFADRGEAGWKAATSAADKFERDGRIAEIVLPPSIAAKDFNDWLREGAAS